MNKGVIFDLDGTLLNTIDDMANSMNFVLKTHGFPVHEVEKYRYFVGNGMKKMVERALPVEIRDDKMIKLCLKEFKNEYNKRWHEYTKPYSGINELVDKLHSMGISISVLSNKADDFTRLIIYEFFGKECFDIVLGARKGIPKKPSPQAALEISRILKIHPWEYLYLGDSGVDMDTAVNAGMYPVGAAWGFREESELLENGAKILLKNPVELIGLI
jgi:phosphoglycolate phosphatase